MKNHVNRFTIIYIIILDIATKISIVLSVNFFVFLRC